MSSKIPFEHTLIQTPVSKYQRIALINEENKERLTFDFNLTFQYQENQKAFAIASLSN